MILPGQAIVQLQICLRLFCARSQMVIAIRRAAIALCGCAARPAPQMLDGHEDKRLLYWVVPFHAILHSGHSNKVTKYLVNQ